MQYINVLARTQALDRKVYWSLLITKGFSPAKYSVNFHRQIDLSINLNELQNQCRYRLCCVINYIQLLYKNYEAANFAATISKNVL